MSDVTIEEGSPVELTVEEGDPVVLTLSLGPSVLDGDKGDVTVSGGGTTWTIDSGAVTFAKMQAVSANVLLGNDATGTTVQEITCTSAGRDLLDDADAAAQRTTLGLGTLATQSGTFSGTSSGTNTGDQTITLTGDVTGSGTGSFAATIANDAVTFAKMQAVNANVLLGNDGTGTTVEEITCTAAGRALIDDADASAQRTTLGVVAGGAGDIWVEKAGDTMTGTLTISRGTTTDSSATSVSATHTRTAVGSALCNQTFQTIAPTSDSSSQFSAFFSRSTFNTASNLTAECANFQTQGGYIGAGQTGTISSVFGFTGYGTIVDGSSASPTITSAMGARILACGTFGAGATPTCTTATALNVSVANGTNWTISTARGILVSNPGASTITDCIGIDIGGQTRGSGTNVGVRIAASSGGTTTAALQLSGTTGAASGILFGSSASADTNLYRRGANLLATDDTFEALNVSGTNTGDQLTYSKFTPVDNAPPAANAATSGLRNRIPVLEFDDATDETAYFIDIMPQGAKLTSGLKVRIHWTAATATTGNCYWAVAFERLNTDIDADSFGADTLSAATTNATSGVPNVTEITVTTIDGITAGDAFRLRIVRQASDALDTMTGDAQIIAVEIRSAV